MKNDQIVIFDTTLRDGEQCPGASMNSREKMEIARQLARLKVDVIEAGFPITSEGDFNSVQSIAREIKGPIIAGLARCVPKDIDAAGIKAAHLVYKVDQAHKRPAMIRWITVGLSLAVVLLVFGFYVGMYLHG